MKLTGMPLELAAYRGSCLTNSRFREFDLARMEFFYLPMALIDLVDEPPVETREFIEDDNRGAVLPHSVATIDGTEFFLSVKGVGSTIDPYSWRPLDRAYAAELSDDREVQGRLRRRPATATDRIITGELWLRGSPYGGQGLELASAALRVSERADVTSIAGFRVAPVVKICQLPQKLSDQLRSIHWYRKYQGPMVQELRLVPSNVRVFFHAQHTIGSNIRPIFDLFQIGSNARALRFEVNFVRSTIAMLTLFARTMNYDRSRREYVGLDFEDVWLDKDAVLAPDGTAYFVDLEGIVEHPLEKDRVREKIDDQLHRSLYELTFAYEQMEGERIRRFGSAGPRKGRFEAVLREALRTDPFVRVLPGGPPIELEIRNNCEEGSLYTRFRAVEE